MNHYGITAILAAACLLSSLAAPGATRATGAALPIGSAALSAASPQPAGPSGPFKETSEQRDARMKWWREARFGMFVHWGLYSGLGGTWKGKPVASKGGMEWIQQRVKTDTDTYARAAIPLFKPAKDFARGWARLAKEAGCRYLVFTTKHHDGFALHDSKVSDYDAGSVLDRDLVKEIVDAARAEGLRVGFYHSVIDWHHDQYAYANSKQLPHPFRGKPYPNGERDHSKYVDYLHAEVNELVSNYGAVDVMWWDYSAQDFQGDEAWRATELMALVRAKQPAIIMNNRLYRIPEAGWTGMGTAAFTGSLDPKYGDFITPEQHIPDTGMPGTDWETCMTMNTTWGYSDHDHAWKSDETLIRNLIDIASKGGNYLLNIGPKGDGSVPDPSVKSMHAIGAWLKVNGEAIYATAASPVAKPTWGRCTQKRLPNGNTRLYLHVFDWPQDGKLVLAGLTNRPLKASLLAGGKALEVSAADNAIVVAVPSEAPDPVASVIALDIKGAPQITQTASASAQAPSSPRPEEPGPMAKETPEQRDARMKWWREARFGMFIHWGLYAIPAGVWNGEDVKGIGEWIMDHANIPVAEYEKLAKQFNPVRYDPAEWVRIAKDAGIKYIVITSKHHDGFSLFDSQATNYDVVDATPYGKDLLNPLADECRKQGLRFAVYYSIMDWHHPSQYPANDKKYNPTNIHPERKSEYLAYLKQQLKELLDTVNPEILWFDGEWPAWWTEEDGRDVYAYLRALKPELIINNRIGKGRKGMEGLSKGDAEYVGDYGTPEQQIPATGLPGVDWESCMTMNDTWGFKKTDQNWKSAETLVRNLVDSASKGGNYLLNVGPAAEGLIPEPSVERLAAVGKWMKANAESIYATQANPLGNLPWGRCTRKALEGGKNRLYLHVFDWPKDGKLVLAGLANEPAGAFLLDGGAKVQVSRQSNQVTLDLPGECPDKTDTVVVLDIQGEPNVVKINPYEDETPAQRNARMKWWREARFGMFIHWGVYSVPAGTYDGKQIAGIGEWIMNRGKIPVAVYKQYAKQFNPVKYDPDEWVRLAKEAGMKYIVITSKHHDGFALFDSKVTDWDVVDATPYGKDLLKPLAEACRKHGIRLGFYYSQAQDWCHPGGAASGGHWDKAQDGSMDEYIRKIAAPQVKEILSNYGPLAVLWWDTPRDMTPERAAMLLPLIRLQLGIIINNRLGGGYPGDTDTPEQHIPATGIPGRDWETCMTMNGTWGYKSYDHNWKSIETLLRNLVDIASKGGNYLLNVGPTSEGLIPQPSVERLKAVGKWMKVNGESIYATQANPFGSLPWGRCTRKGNTLYLHVFDWPQGGLEVPGLLTGVAKAYLLADADRKPLTVTPGDRKVVVSLPPQPVDPIDTVVVLELAGELKLDPSALPKPAPTKGKAGKKPAGGAKAEPKVIRQSDDGRIVLPARNARLHGEKVQYESGDGKDNIGYWTNPKDSVSWEMEVVKPGNFTVEVTYACSSDSGGSKYEVSLAAGDGPAKAKLEGAVKSTGSWSKFATVKLGEMKIDAAGKAVLKVQPLSKPGMGVMNLQAVTLSPKG